jgi:hypothetical protein
MRTVNMYHEERGREGGREERRKVNKLFFLAILGFELKAFYLPSELIESCPQNFLLLLFFR